MSLLFGFLPVLVTLIIIGVLIYGVVAASLRMRFAVGEACGRKGRQGPEHAATVEKTPHMGLDRHGPATTLHLERNLPLLRYGPLCATSGGQHLKRNLLRYFFCFPGRTK